MPRSIFGWRGVTSCAVVAAAVSAVLLSCAQIIGLSSLDRVACVGDCGTDAGKVDAHDAGPPKTDTGTCDKGCCSDKDCTQSTEPRCYVQTGTCVPCLPASLSDAGAHDCPVGMTCTPSGNSFGCAVGCSTAADCPTDAGTPACCSGACVYPANDPKNCGGCGNACSNNGIMTPTCGDGGCNGACNTGSADCDMDKLTNGCEVNVKGMDTTNCGGCGVVCSTNNIPDASCVSGVCNGLCATGYAACGRSLVGDAGDAGCAVHTEQGDPNNCGGCGIVCSTSHVQTLECQGAMCVVTLCDPGWVACGDQQTSGCDTFVMGNDCNHCGGCSGASATCTASEQCCNGQLIPMTSACISDAGMDGPG